MSCEQSFSLLPCAIPAHGRPVIASTLTDKLTALGTWHPEAMGIMRLAKTLHLGWSIALRAFDLRPATRTAKIQPVSGLIALLYFWGAALSACIKTFFILVPPFIVMMTAKTPSKMRAITKRAFRLWAMNTTVLRFVCAQSKIFYAVIVSHFILVMDFFFAGKMATDKLLHNQPMLLNVSTPTAVGMIWHFYLHVAVVIFKLFSRFPVWRSFHGNTLTLNLLGRKAYFAYEL